MDDLLLDEMNILDYSFHTKDEISLYHGFQVYEDFPITTRIGTVFNFEFVNIQASTLNGRFLLISYSADFDKGEDLFSILLQYAKGLSGFLTEENYNNIYLTCKKFKFKNKTVIGLIGELGFIYYKLNCGDFGIIGMWHAESNDTFDFYNSDYIFEVKTTKNVIRKHTFNCLQMVSLKNAEIHRKALLVSFQLFKGDEAHTINDLVELIKSKLNILDLSIFLNKLEFYTDLLTIAYRFNIDDLIGGMKFYLPSKLPSVEFDRNYIDENNLKYVVIFENLVEEILI